MQRRGDEPALSPVVKVALERAALLVAGRDEARPRAAQLLGLLVQLRPQPLVLVLQVRRRALDQHVRPSGSRLPLSLRRRRRAELIAAVWSPAMRGVTVIPPGAGEVIGDAPDRRVEILSDHPSLHATWSRFGPGRDGADLHVHHRHTDLFYVLVGELTMRLGPQGEEARVPAGSLVRVPPGVVHGFRNGSD